jgi:hypothetical protein
MYMSDLRHIHDPALSSLKMKGISTFLFIYCDMISTRVLPGGIPRDIYILVYSFFILVRGCVSLGLQLCSSGVFMGSGLILVDLAACEKWL